MLFYAGLGLNVIVLLMLFGIQGQLDKIDKRLKAIAPAPLAPEPPQT